MKNLVKIMHRSQAGFTLIELLVVIAILGTLAGIVALNVGSFIGSGHDQAACTEQHQVQTAVLAYAAGNNNTLPGDIATAAATYIVGTVKGTYTYNSSTGLVTQTAYPGGDGSPCSN